MNEKNVRAAQEHRFCRVTAFYVLIYTPDNLSEKDAAEIAGEDTERLSSADRDWLLSCNIALIAEDAMERENEISASLGERIGKLEEALRRAKEEAEHGGGT